MWIKALEKGLLLTSTVVALAVSSLILYFLLAPLYIVKGGGSGFVSVFYYNVEVFGRAYRSPLLDSLPLLFAPLLLVALTNILASVILLKVLFLSRRDRPGSWVVGVLYGNSLGGLIVVYGFLPIVSKLIRREIIELSRVYAQDTLIGLVVFDKVDLKAQPPVYFIQAVLPYLVLVYVAVSAILYVVYSYVEFRYSRESSPY